MKLRNILVVDDEEAICQMLTHLLQNERLKIFTAGDLNHAVELLDTYSFELVFSDMHMLGEKDGLAVLKHCRKKDKDTKVIIVTAHGSLSGVDAARRLGATGYLFKPFSNDDIYDIAQMHLGMNLR